MCVSCRFCDEYRPINKVTAYEKVLKQIVKNQLDKHCDKLNVLSDNKCGFRKNPSCETTLVNCFDKWLKEIDLNNKYILVIFLDFKRAFETIDRNLSTAKIEKNGDG